MLLLLQLVLQLMAQADHMPSAVDVTAASAAATAGSSRLHGLYK